MTMIHHARGGLGLTKLRLMSLGLLTLLLALVFIATGCLPFVRKGPAEITQVGTLGSVEITARLLEVPEGAIIERRHYDYAAVLKYEVLEIHRGEHVPTVIYIAHYNPFKPRSQAADARVVTLGGTVTRFEAGQIHRMALEPSAEQHYLGGVINLYLEREAEDPWWALWCDLAEPKP